jgi:hypothetical protein
LRDSDERFHWFLYMVILAQFIVIATLLGAFSAEYLSNAYMQSWVRQNAPGLELLLNGNLDVVFIGAAVGFTFLLIQNRREAARTIQAAQASSPPASDPGPTAPVLKVALNGDPAQDLSPPALKRSRTPRKPPDDVLKKLDKTDS